MALCLPPRNELGVVNGQSEMVVRFGDPPPLITALGLVEDLVAGDRPDRQPRQGHRLDQPHGYRRHREPIGDPGTHLWNQSRAGRADSCCWSLSRSTPLLGYLCWWVTWENVGEHAADRLDYWGSRGREFKSRRPDYLKFPQLTGLWDAVGRPDGAPGGENVARRLLNSADFAGDFGAVRVGWGGAVQVDGVAWSSRGQRRGSRFCLTRSQAIVDTVVGPVAFDLRECCARRRGGQGSRLACWRK